MANKTVSNLSELTTVSNNDVLLVETATKTLKVTKGNLLKEVNEQLNAKSNASHTHDEYVTENELNSKGLATESFVTQKIAEASFGDTEGSPIALIEPSDNDVPKLFFTGTFPTTKNSTTMELEYVSKTKRFKGYVDIKCQGTSSMGFPKKNFTIKLYEDKDKTIKMTQNFKKWGEQTKFCLKANYVDTTHTRNISGARVAYDMVESRPDSEFKTHLKASPRNGVIDGFPIKVFNNGMFYGIYTLNIPKDEWMFGMNKDNPKHMVLCAEENNNGNMSLRGTCQFRALWTNSNNSHWSVEVGTLTDEMRNSFNNAIRHVIDTTDEQFVADMDKYFDVDSLIDYFCFSYFMCHLDGLAKNMLMATYDGVHWGACLYDMDSIYGAWHDGTRFVAHDYKCPEQYQENNSLLWQRLSKNFAQKIQDRYFELRKGALSLSNIVSHVENIYDLMTDRDLSEEHSKWTNLPSVNTNTISRFRDYMSKRCSYVDTQMLDFVEIPCTKLTLNTNSLTFTDGNSQKLIATVEPSNTNQPIVWTSSPSGIVSVNNGIVQPLKSGTCTVTVACGEHSASCDVVVDVEITQAVLVMLDSDTLTKDSTIWEDLSGNGNHFRLPLKVDVNEQGLNLSNHSSYGDTLIPIKDNFVVEATFTILDAISSRTGLYALNLDNVANSKYADTVSTTLGYGVRGYDVDLSTDLALEVNKTYSVKLEYGEDIKLYSNGELVGTYPKNTFTPNDAYRISLGTSKYNNNDNLNAKVRLKSFKLYREMLTDNTSYTIPDDYNYGLAIPKTFNGVDDYIDTEMMLFDTDKDFSALLDFSCDTSNFDDLTMQNNPVPILHCTKEQNPWPGVTLTLYGNQNSSLPASERGAIASGDNRIGYGIQNLMLGISKDDTNRHRILIKRVSSDQTVYVYDELGLVGTIEGNLVNTLFSQNVLLGAYQSTGGVKGRFWKGTINECYIWNNRVLSESEINDVMGYSTF